MADDCASRRRLLRLGILVTLAGGAPAVSVVANPTVPQGFFHAIERDDDYDVRIYLLRGATSSLRDAAGTPALVHAAATKAFKVLRSFLAIPGAEVELTNRRDETALMLTAVHGNVALAVLLIEHGAQVNRPRWAPLHYAATGGNAEMVRLLLEHHAFIDAESPNRTTPLMMAVRHGHDALARELIEAGADPTMRNDTGMTAADYASRRDEHRFAAWLRGKSDEFTARYATSSTVRR